MSSLKDFYTIRDAAREIGIRPRTLHKRISRGTVRVERIGDRVVVVPKEEVLRLKGEQAS